MCRLCETVMTDKIAQQKSDKHCLRINNIMLNKGSKYPNKKYVKH